MSEYQYYEFHAHDHLLTESQMRELRRYSSRATITPARFVNVYNWDDFKGDRRQWTWVVPQSTTPPTVSQLPMGARSFGAGSWPADPPRPGGSLH